MPKGHFIPLTELQEQHIRAEYLVKPIKTLAKELGTTDGTIKRRLKKWNLTIPKHIIEARKKIGQFGIGSVPPNKGKKQIEYMSPEAIAKTKHTRFKPGRTPHNTKYDGHERITNDGYIEIRISLGNYRLKHIVEWEKLNGRLPSGHCLICQDENRENTNPDNWKLVTRAENMYRNSKLNFPKQVIPSMVLINKITNQLNTLENGTK